MYPSRFETGLDGVMAKVVREGSVGKPREYVGLGTVWSGSSGTIMGETERRDETPVSAAAAVAAALGVCHCLKGTGVRNADASAERMDVATAVLLEAFWGLDFWEKGFWEDVLPELLLASPALEFEVLAV